MKLKEKLWIWGHPKNRLKGLWKIEKDNDQDPVEGMKYLGAGNVFYVPMGQKTDRDAENIRMQKECLGFGWSVRAKDTAADLIALKEKYPAYKIAVYDDFFRDENEGNNSKNHSPKKLIELKNALNSVGVELWAVYYERDLGVDISAHLECFDGISFWFWSQPTPEDYDEKIKIFFDKTPGIKRMVGCYLYDFGREAPCNPQYTLTELEKDYEFIKKGELCGIILHTNAVGGMGLEAYEAAKEWVQRKTESENV